MRGSILRVSVRSIALHLLAWYSLNSFLIDIVDMRRMKLLALLLFLLAGLGMYLSWRYWDAWSIPLNPDQLTLYSIDGSDYPKESEPKTSEKIGRFPVLGKVEVSDPIVREQILSELRQGIVESGTAAKCFWPRHAIRIVTKGRSIDYIVCFECSQILVKEGARSKIILTSEHARSYFNKVLEEAHIRLAPFHIDRAKKESGWDLD